MAFAINQALPGTGFPGRKLLCPRRWEIYRAFVDDLTQYIGN